MNETRNIQPEFEAVLVEGTFKRTVMVIQETKKMVSDGKGGEKPRITREMVPEEHEYVNAYDVYFPQGHSIRIPSDDEEQLRRVGVLRRPKLIDMETGEAVAEGAAMSPRQIVAAKTRNTRSTGGIAAAMGD